jgi:hypothetical protein
MPPRDLIPVRGRTPKGPVMFEVVRALGPGDIVALATGTIDERNRITPPPLQQIRAVHQRAALLIAQGKNAVEVASLVGRTPQRIRDLMQDPTFTELVASYQAQEIEIVTEEIERARQVALEVHELAMCEIRERLDDPERIKQLPMSELRQVATMAGDRTVLPPKTAAPPSQTPPQITFNFSGRGLRPVEDEGEKEKPHLVIDNEEKEKE